MGLFDFGKKNRQTTEAAPEQNGADTGALEKQWNSLYLFVPVFEKPVEMPSEEEIQDGLSRRLGHMVPTLEPLPDFPKEKGFMVWDLWEHIAHDAKDQTRHPARLVMTGSGAFNKGQWDDHIIRQFWSCGATRREFAARCNYSFICSILLEGALPRKRYYHMVAEFADAILELFPDCIGIYWPGSQNLVPREYFQEAHWENRELHFLDGGLNIRMFRFENRKEVLYDTLGLELIGLRDLQIYSRDLEPEIAIPFLKNIASYLFLNGNVLKSGSPMVGMDKKKWICREEDSMTAPGRKVLSLYPLVQNIPGQNGEENAELQERKQ